MELYTLRYVLAVADSGNFSLAAQACHVGQPALSQQIAKLEKELGVALFARNPRGATLTEAGKDFVLRAREILQRAQALQAEMSFYAGLRKGSLNLGIITSLQCINFGGMLSAFCGSYPDISVNIVQEGTHRLLELLLDRKVDLAFLNRPLSQLASSLEFVKLGEDHYSLAVPRVHPLAGREEVSLRELRGEHFIFHQTGQVAAELCLTACRRAGFEPPASTWSRAGLGLPFCPRRTSAPIPSPASGRSNWRSGSSRRWGWPGAGTRPPPWWTPQSSSPGNGSNDRPLLFLFSPCPSCCIIEPFH